MSQSAIEEDQALKGAFLSALYQRHRAGKGSPSIDMIAEDMGRPKNDETVARISKELREAGLISGAGSFGGGIVRPEITEAGRQFVASM